LTTEVFIESFDKVLIKCNDTCKHIMDPFMIISTSGF
jgi:hypothetical protein